MARQLDVYLHRHLAGRLEQDDGGQMLFEYAPLWLRTPDALALSVSLPLREEQFRQKECAGFFNGILPEEDTREMLARNLGISARNDYSMLEQIGGECAGAVTFMPSGTPLPEGEGSYIPLTEKLLAEKLRLLPKRPLLAGEDGVRMSLAGAQAKIAVHVAQNGDISLPVNDAPSTHILKPANGRFPGIVYNELLCLNLARAANLAAAKALPGKAEEIEYLLVERYDRRLLATPGGVEYTQRLHQEDFCQAQGIVSTKKYQKEGGPTLKNCLDLVRQVSALPVTDLQRFLNAVIFNYLIGNCDAHGKNFSLLHFGRDELRLAPLYDLICTDYYPELTKKMAMKIGGENTFETITPRHFDKFAEEAGLAKPLVRQSVAELSESVLDTLGRMKIEQEDAIRVAAIIRDRCQRTLADFGPSR